MQHRRNIIREERRAKILVIHFLNCIYVLSFNYIPVSDVVPRGFVTVVVNITLRGVLKR